MAQETEQEKFYRQQNEKLAAEQRGNVLFLKGVKWFVIGAIAFVIGGALLLTLLD